MYDALDEVVEDILNRARKDRYFKEVRKDVLDHVGRGSMDPKIIVIGDLAPLPEKVTREKNTSYAYHRMFRQMIAKAGIDLSDIYWTDIWKFSLNRRPTPKELDRAAGYLYEELDYLRPKVIVPLGQHTIEQFFDGECITNLRGEGLAFDLYDTTAWMIPLVHPRTAWLDKEERERMGEDLDTISYYLRRKKRPSIAEETEAS